MFHANSIPLAVQACRARTLVQPSQAGGGC
jgi:hypothetical protein